MAKVCYIIHKANKNEVKIDAVVGVEAAKERAKNGGILVTGADRLQRMNGTTVVAIYNAVSREFGLPEIKRFETKAVGAKRTLKLLDQTFGKRAKVTGTKTPKKIRHSSGPVTVFDGDREIYGRNARGINLEPKPVIKEPGEASKRAAVLALILREDGATHEELARIVGHGRNHVRVFLHDLNRRCGYGIQTVEVEDANNRYIGYAGVRPLYAERGQS